MNIQTPPPIKEPVSVFLIGSSEEFQFSMKFFPELLQRLLCERGIGVTLLRPKTVFGRFADLFPPLKKWLFHIDKHILFPLTLKKAKRARSRNAIFHICDHSNSIYTRYLKDIPILITCHDLLAVRSALGDLDRSHTSWSGRYLQMMNVNGLRSADFVACVSEATRRDLLRITSIAESKTEVVYNAPHYPYSPLPRSAACALAANLIGTTAPFILHVGGNSWYKNRRGALEIYSRVRELIKKRHPERQIKLVLVGEQLSPEIQRFLFEHDELTDEVISIQGASNEDLRVLYSVAELFLFPSFDEGFGWPIIEAQACGCPVMTTNKAPMTEVGGTGAYYIEPSDVPSAALAVGEFLSSPAEVRDKLIQRGFANSARFSLDMMISNYIRLYERILCS